MRMLYFFNKSTYQITESVSQNLILALYNAD